VITAGRRVPYGNMIPHLWCVICRENTCEIRTASAHGTYTWCIDEVTPPDPDEDLLPWLHGRTRQGWWDRIGMRGVA
jgi:hypothetical protein